MRLLMLMLTNLTLPALAWGQVRAWDGQWELHPIWWPLAALALAFLLLVLLGWALLNLAPKLGPGARSGYPT